MDIKLYGALPRQLRELNLKPGDKFQDVEKVPGAPYGAVKIKLVVDEEEIVATVYQENYRIF